MNLNALKIIKINPVNRNRLCFSPVKFEKHWCLSFERESLVKVGGKKAYICYGLFWFCIGNCAVASFKLQQWSLKQQQKERCEFISRSSSSYMLLLLKLVYHHFTSPVNCFIALQWTVTLGRAPYSKHSTSRNKIL